MRSSSPNEPDEPVAFVSVGFLLVFTSFKKAMVFTTATSSIQKCCFSKKTRTRNAKKQKKKKKTRTSWLKNLEILRKQRIRISSNHPNGWVKFFHLWGLLDWGEKIHLRFWGTMRCWFFPKLEVWVGEESTFPDFFRPKTCTNSLKLTM